MERRNFVKIIIMQIYRMGKLEEPIKPVFKIYLGISGGLQQRNL